ncbi:MAG: DNA primase DnaG [Halobacteriaceae archaeon]
MEDTAKYLIHAEVATEGVVEHADVVGAVYGQTEGLLGDELDLHDLQESAKLGRIDVDVRTQDGRSAGTLTVASNLDRVETAVLAAALETIDQVGPCRARVTVDRIEDVRAAKRRTIVERAEELLEDGFDEGQVAGDDLVEAVRASRRVAELTTHEGLPAGPNVADGDAVVLVEGRADVRTLLSHGVKNAAAVGGTDVADAAVALTRERTATAFVDGDRGGDLVLRELAQRGDLDFVATAPEGRAVEDLSREEALDALRAKVPAATALAGDGSVRSGAEGGDTPANRSPAGSGATREAGGATAASPAAATEDAEGPEAAATPGPTATEPDPGAAADTDDGETDAARLAERVRTVLDDTGRAVCYDAAARPLSTCPADAVVDALRDADRVPHAVVVDGPVEQALVDVAARRGVELVVGHSLAGVTTQPAAVRVLTPSDLRAD